jgi:hypothetical protein
MCSRSVGDHVPSEEPRNNTVDYLGLLVYGQKLATVKHEDEVPAAARSG